MAEIRGHIRLRKGLLHHIDIGKMKFDMLAVFTYLLLKADFTCGIVWGTSAPYIGQKLRKPAKHINRQLLKLEAETYIKRFGHRGQISSYEILINKYLVFNGVLIDAVNTTDINEIAWVPGVNGEIIGNYKRIKLESTVFYLSPYKEIKNIIIKKIEDQKPAELFDSFGWKQDINIYLEYELSSFNLLIQDEKYISRLQKKYPDIDVEATMTKSHQNYWAGAGGHENERKKSGDTIDWERAYEISCGKQWNQVLKGKVDDYPPAHPSHIKFE